MLGGGQLGRMFTHAAQRMGYRVAVYEAESDCPAGQAADRHFHPDANESVEPLVEEFARLCDVVTLEFENIDPALVRQLESWTKTSPGAEFLSICQDRIREKTAVRDAGFPTTPFMAVGSPEAVQAAGDELGWPLVLKTATSGYDGKGQTIVKSPAEIDEAWKLLGTDHVIAEQWIAFEAEVSMITARNERGEIASYPLFENTHANHILDITRCPVSEELSGCELQAAEICHGLAKQFSVVGLFCVEFFVSKQGELMVNEIAPRPHNSGHLTIEAFNCSQFEQQLRAICNLPLAQTQQLKPAAMANLLGDIWFPEAASQSSSPSDLSDSGEPNWAAAMRYPWSYLHLYGKAEPRLGRKMGHLTVLDSSSLSASQRAAQIRQALRQ